MSQVLVLVVVLLCASTVSARSAGAPVTACLDLSPAPTQHGADPQTGMNPYELGNFMEAFTNDDGVLGYVPGQTYDCKFLIL